MNKENLVDYVAEQSVLGSCMLNNEVIERVMFLTVDDFFSAAHKHVFESIVKCFNEGLAVDMITLDAMVDDELAPYSYLAELVKNTPSAANAVAYADIVKDMSNRRAVLDMLSSCRDSLFNRRENTIGTVSNLTAEIDQVVSNSSIGEVLSIEDLIQITADKMDESNQGIKVGLKTGIPEIDERLGYKDMAFGAITVLGGLSKNGKTLVANTISSRLNLEGNEVGHIFSIEMTCDAMFNAMISARTGVPANFYVKQDYYANSDNFSTMHGRWGAAAEELYNSGTFTFDGKKEVNAEYICANMKKQASIARQKGKVLRYVMIDHLHRMNFDLKSHGSMTYAIRDSVRKITNTAAELGVAVLLLAQLNNKAENEIPSSFHILDSSSVRHELQAFIGVKMYRDNGDTYFGIHADSQRFGDEETKHHPAYLKLIGGVLASLPEYQKHWTPNQSNDDK